MHRPIQKKTMEWVYPTGKINQQSSALKIDKNYSTWLQLLYQGSPKRWNSSGLSPENKFTNLPNSDTSD